MAKKRREDEEGSSGFLEAFVDFLLSIMFSMAD